MQRTADFHDQIADARLAEAVCLVHNATALHTAVHVLDADTPTGDAPIRRFLRLCELPSSRLLGRHDHFDLRERRDVGPYLFTGRKGPLQKRQVQQLFIDYASVAGIQERSVHALRHSMAVHLLEAGRGIEYVADHLGHKNIQNTRIYAQSTHPLREQVFRELEQHPKIVRLS